jgi:ATP-dependent Clp protease ATP-binding subunit ClpA
MANREGLQEKGLQVVWTKDVIKLLATKGFDKRYGARPLQRTIETLLTSPLAEFLLENNELRDAKISVEIGKDKNLKFKK